MPAQTSKSGLMAKLGERAVKAFEAHKSDETKYGGGFGDLPPGITGGVARLTGCKFDVVQPGKQNAGEYYFSARGVVVAPKTFGGQVIEGAQTSIMEMLCNTPGRTRATLDEHMAWVLNELRKLGVNTEEIGAADLEGVAAALVEQGPYFKFRTWQGDPTPEYPNPRVNEQWLGVVDWSPGEGGPGEAVADNTGKAAARNGTTTGRPAAGRPTANPTNRLRAAAEPPPGPAEDFDEFSGQLGAQAAAADQGDEAAMDFLRTKASEAGVDEADVDGADSWADVVKLIEGAGGPEEGGGGEEGSEEPEGGQEAEAAEEPWEPVKEDVYKYTVLDPKTGKPAVDPKTKKPRKAVEVEVAAVNKAKKTVDVKQLDNPKVVYKAVPWDRLESAE